MKQKILEMQTIFSAIFFMNNMKVYTNFFLKIVNILLSIDLYIGPNFIFIILIALVCHVWNASY